MYIRARSHTGPAAHQSLRPRRTRLGFGVAAPPATKLLLHVGVVVFCDKSPFALECMQRVVVVFCKTTPFALECMQRGVRGMRKSVVPSSSHETSLVVVLAAADFRMASVVFVDFWATNYLTKVFSKPTSSSSRFCWRAGTLTDAATPAVARALPRARTPEK